MGGTPATGTPLSARELQVARLVAGGLTNLEIANELGLQSKTVEHHLTRAYAKLGLHSRTQLAVHVLSAGLAGDAE